MESIYGNWLIVFESQLKCAGMCTPIDYYLFIGTDQGSPKYSCQVAITQLLEDNAGWYAGWSFFIGIIGIMSGMTSIGMFFVERKTFMHTNFYKYSKSDSD